MRVHLYTFCWNERKIIPFVAEYWKNFADNVTVFDNGSTDGSIDLLKGYGCEVRQYLSGDGQDNLVMRDIKNTCWKESRKKDDFVVVCDMDELLCAPDIKFSLYKMQACGGTVNIPQWYDFITDEEPEPIEGMMLHEYSSNAVMCCNPKYILFNPSRIEEMNYDAGAHHCQPTGDVRYFGSDISVLHLNNNLSLEYKIERYKTLNVRRSTQDIRNHHGIHYELPEDVLREAYQEQLNHSINFAEIMRG